MSARFGRIPLDRIITEWEDGHPINPRLLAGEVAALLRTAAPADHPIHEAFASAILSAMPGGCAVTHGALVDYFEGAGSGRPPAMITTTTGSVPASAVLVWRQWINRLADEATSRALYVAGRAIPAGDSSNIAMAANASPTASQTEQPPLPSGSEPGYVAMRQREQRREGERRAAEQLEAKDIALQHALSREAAKDAIIATMKAQLQLSREEAEDERRRRIESDRARAELAEQLREHAGIIEFVNPENALSPVEGRRLVAIWCELTENGTVDAATDSGIGVGTLARDWWRKHVGEPSDTEVKRLRWALTWPARKGGGVVARRPRNKG
ncbi:hypothetical protein E5198_06285 [Pseudomonas sp. A-1]|uniref:hypothetical protein n=1 Tax=Pseudomonas sp. A-1 TaxID=1821274 RepID=UPI0010A6676B|nr:hypothetical protein [Pseudomonas sp. A-1]THG83901.1 hypothetical protein E5198_06285 [Pseudomonas sp. A-1]